MPATLAFGSNVGPITVGYTQPPSGTSTVTATVSSSTLDPNPANNTASAAITGVAMADLASKVNFPTMVYAGQPVSGTVLYTNNGPSSASGVTFALALSPNLAAAPTISGLPAGAAYSYNSSSGVVTLTGMSATLAAGSTVSYTHLDVYKRQAYSYNSGSGVVTLAGMPTTLASGASVGPITVSYTQPPAGTSTVTATDSSSTLDSNPANNSATATISGSAQADLASAVSFPASVNAGQAVSGSVTYTNNGPSTASGVSFGLTLSASLPATPLSLIHI